MTPKPDLLKALSELGQSVWYDYIRRDLLESGELERLIRDDGLRGMTSNPTIFQKAIVGTPLYDEDILRAAREKESPVAILRALAVADVQRAADMIRHVLSLLPVGLLQTWARSSTVTGTRGAPSSLDEFNADSPVDAPFRRYHLCGGRRWRLRFSSLGWLRGTRSGVGRRSPRIRVVPGAEGAPASASMTR